MVVSTQGYFGCSNCVSSCDQWESLPSDYGPWDISLVAARRKEEALRSAHAYGGIAHFLNIPDRIVDSFSSDEQWNIDSIALKIASVITLTKPHIILLYSGTLPTVGIFQTRS